jgi:hypothetical protein
MLLLIPLSYEAMTVLAYYFVPDSVFHWGFQYIYLDFLCLFVPVLYELVSGRRPFEAENIVSLAMLVCLILKD